MAYLNSEGYKRFRGWVALQKVSAEPNSEKVWKYYDYGAKDKAPLVMLPGTSAAAEAYYKQFLSLCPKGYRLVSVQPPDYVTIEAFCKGFEKFLDKLEVEKVHLFGTSVGGFLAQCFTQTRPKRVLSLLLCNTFADTSHYKENAPCIDMFTLMPEFMLKRIILQNFPEGHQEQEIANSIDFMVSSLESLSGKELAGRLILNCTTYPLKPSDWTFDKRKITIIDSIDEVAIPSKLREELYKYYPEAKIAEVKTGGNFVWLSRPDEVNMLIQVHLRNAENMEEPEEYSEPQEEPKELNQKEEVRAPASLPIVEPNQEETQEESA